MILAGLSGAAWDGLRLGLTSQTCAVQPEKAALTDRDPFGGCMDIALGETGFFRLHKTDRWWLVTPAGNAYLSLADMVMLK